MKELRIAVDAHRVSHEQQTSGYRYLTSVLCEWDANPAVDKIYLLIPKMSLPHSIPEWITSLDKVALIEDDKITNPLEKWRRQLFYQQVTIPKLLRETDANLYFSPFHLPPIWTRGIPVVTAIHDLCVLEQPTPKLGYWKHREIHRFQIQLAAWKSKRLIAVSEYTARALDGYLKLWRPEIVVVPNGLNLDELPAVYDLGNAGRHPYILWVGYPGYRKNPALMFATFKNMRRIDKNLRVVCVTPSRTLPDMEKLALRNDVDAFVDFYSEVTCDALGGLYRNAELCIVSSRCEGFGYPLLEAISRGCPAIGWEDSPAKEILGDILTLPKHLDADEFARCAGLIPRKGAKTRNKLEQLLIERSHMFSAKRSANRMIEVFLNCVNDKLKLL